MDLINPWSAMEVSTEFIGAQVVMALLQVADELESGALLTIDPNRTRVRLLPLRLALSKVMGLHNCCLVILDSNLLVFSSAPTSSFVVRNKSTMRTEVLTAKRALRSRLTLPRPQLQSAAVRAL